MASFLDLDRIKKLINGLKVWIVNNIGMWWIQFKMSRTDWEKTAWGFSVGTVDNADSEFKKDPKLWLRTNDWMYSQWNETSYNGEFPLPCAPKQDMTDVNKDKIYYTDQITVNPGMSTLTLNGSMMADKFISTTNPDPLAILMANGTTKSVVELYKNAILTGFSERDFYDGSTFDGNKILAYEIESGIELLNGSGGKDDLMFFQLLGSGTVFRRINRIEGDTSGRFWARTLDGDLIAWVGDNYLVFSYTTPDFGFQGTDSVTNFMTNTVKIEING